jgi:hypothetical protein
MVLPFDERSRLDGSMAPLLVGPQSSVGRDLVWR